MRNLTKSATRLVTTSIAIRLFYWFFAGFSKLPGQSSAWEWFGLRLGAITLIKMSTPCEQWGDRSRTQSHRSYCQFFEIQWNLWVRRIRFYLFFYFLFCSFFFVPSKKYIYTLFVPVVFLSFGTVLLKRGGV